MNETLKAIQLDGNNNVVLQSVSASGDITINTLDWDTFVQRYTYEQQAHIQELQKLLERSEKLFDLEKLQLSQKINKLQAEKETIEAQVKRMIEEYADKDLRQTDALYRQAFELFLAGQLDEALAILDDAKLEAELLKAQETQRQVAESYSLKADILQLQYDFKGAENYFQRAFAAYPDWDNCFSLASIYHKLGQFLDAEAQFQKCIELVGNEEELAMTLENLATVQFAEEKYNIAEKNYWRAIKIYDKLVVHKSRDYSLNIVNILSGLKIICEKNNNEISENLQWRILKIRRKSAEVMPVYDLSVCETNINLINFYFEKIEKQISTEEDAQHFATLLSDTETRLQRFPTEIPLVQHYWNQLNYFKQFITEEEEEAESNPIE